MRLLDRLLTFAAVLAVPLIILGAFKGGAQGINALRQWRAVRQRASLADSLLSAQGVFSLGDGPSALLEFVDYQCPACRSADSILAQLPSGSLGLRIVVFQFPLEDIHPFAFRAAKASVCAAKQGAFEAFHHALYSADSAAAPESYWRFARAGGARDSAAFEQCYRAPATDSLVRSHLALGTRLGVRGTPTFVSAEGKLSSLTDVLNLARRSH